MEYKTSFAKRKFYWKGYEVNDYKILNDQNTIAYKFRLIKGDCYVNNIYMNETIQQLNILEFLNNDNEEHCGQIEIRKGVSDVFLLSVSEKQYTQN